jgi:hypothetical protein
LSHEIGAEDRQLSVLDFATVRAETSLQRRTEYSLTKDRLTQTDATDLLGIWSCLQRTMNDDW